MRTYINVGILEPANQIPTVNAGEDLEITLPTDTVQLLGTASDPDGTIESYLWSQVSGSAATIATPSNQNTIVSGLTEGSYVFRLTVTDDDGGASFDDVNILVNQEVFNTHSLVIPSLGTGIIITDNALYPSLGGGIDKPFSIEVSIKPTAMTNLGYFVLLGDDSGSRVAVMHEGNGAARMDLTSSSGNRLSGKTLAGTIELDKWNHFIFTYNGSKALSGLKIYEYDIAYTSLAGSSSQGTYAGFPELQGNFMVKSPNTPGSDASKFIGKISMLRMYDKELTQEEALELLERKGPRSLSGLPVENNCILEHMFNNSLESNIGTDATAVGSLTYDTDVPPVVGYPSSTLDFAPTVLDSIYWPSILKASDWPQITTTKPYFTIYSTDHSTAGGGIAWGECDDMFGNGFIERGVIVSGYQAETPILLQVPTSVSGLASDTLFLYYHTVTGEPGNDGKQQTRLITTTGGVLHEAVWNDRGRPLGIFNDDVHTGYATPRFNDAGKIIASHLTVGGSSPKTYTSTSDDGLTFTRVVETTNLTVDGYAYMKNEVRDFIWSGTRYGFIGIKVGDLVQIAIATLDENFLPVDIVTIINKYYDIRQMMASIEGSTAYIRFKGGSNTNRFEPYYQITYDLTQLN